MSRCYPVVRFIGQDGEPKGKPYTYHYDGEPPESGSFARVETLFEGEKLVEVQHVEYERPRFKTQPLKEVLPLTIPAL